jgi:protein-S-isoprenylcysteine O-methyltransferase Ste14
MSSSTARWPWIAPILIYAVSALEMIIMISPAAAYFYSVYTPLFHGFEQSALTAWLPQFFLPHLAQTRLPFFRWLSWLGAGMALLGLVGFLVCAAQLYYGKFVKKRVVSGGLYGRVRHPQYLCLAVAGTGFLLLWPRFFILVTYLIMLGLYYLLARHEEETIRKRYGKPAEEYLATVPMFNPLRGRRRPGESQPPPRGRALLTWIAVSAASIGLAFLLRAVAVDQLYVRQAPSPEVTSLSLKARADQQIDALTQFVLATSPLRALVEREPEASLFLQIVSGSSQLKHLLIDLGMKEDAVDAIASGDQADFAVVSRVVPRTADAGGQHDPLGFGTRIEPLFLARVTAPQGEVSVSALPPGEFHPGFSRIRF